MKARDSIVALAVAIVGLTSLPARAEMAEIAVAQQYGISYLPLMLMEEKKLIEKHAKAAGIDVKVGWAKFAGGNVMNDALLSGSLQFASGGVGRWLRYGDAHAAISTCAASVRSIRCRSTSSRATRTSRRSAISATAIRTLLPPPVVQRAACTIPARQRDRSLSRKSLIVLTFGLRVTR